MLAKFEKAGKTWKDSSGSLSPVLMGLAVFYGALLRVARLLSDPDFVYPDALRHFLGAEEISVAEPTSWFAVHRGYLPFAVWNRLLFGLTLHHPLIQRFGTVLLSIGLVYLVASTVRRRCGKWPGVYAAFLVAISPPLIRFSDSGLRNASLMCLLVGLYAILLGWKSEKIGEQGRWVAAAVLGWATFLVRVDLAGALVCLFLFAFVKDRVWRSLHHLTWGATVFAVLMGAVFLANWSRYGNAFYFTDPQKNTFRYWANLEFHGQAGFPTDEEYEVFSRTGTPLSGMKYFGEVLGWRESVSRFYRGYRSLFLGNVATGVYSFTAFPNQIGIVGILTLLGLGLAIVRKQWEIPLLIPLLVASTIWTYHIPEGREFRFFLPVVPFAVIAAADAVAWIWNRLSRLAHPKLRWGLATGLLFLLFRNPWNHEPEVSFPWRVGPVVHVPSSATRIPVEFGQNLVLVGWELRAIGPLGLWDARFDDLEAGRRFRIGLYWKSLKEIHGDGTYAVALRRPDLETFGTVRERPLTSKYPVKYWQQGQIVYDEFEYVVFPRVPPGPVSITLHVSGAGFPEEATTTLTGFEILPIGWHPFEPRDWG